MPGLAGTAGPAGTVRGAGHSGDIGEDADTPESLDRDIAELLRRLADTPTPDLSSLPPGEFRKLFDEGLAVLGPQEPGPPVASVEDADIDGPGGEKIPIRIYRDRPDAGRPPAAVAFFHGGGWCVGTVGADDLACRQLCHHSGAVVVSVGYRLAPEHRFPAALDDCGAALRFLADHAAALGADPGRLVVAGDSAGANLAAALTLAARDGPAPTPAAQVLLSPAVDLTLSQPSVDRYGAGYLLTASALRWFVDSYLGDHDAADPLASPLHAPDLRKLPPALVVTAGFDPLVDEGRAYARRLEDAGTTVRTLHFPTLVHGFMALGSLSAAAARATHEVWDAVAALLAA